MEGEGKKGTVKRGEGEGEGQYFQMIEHGAEHALLVTVATAMLLRVGHGAVEIGLRAAPLEVQVIPRPGAGAVALVAAGGEVAALVVVIWCVRLHSVSDCILMSRISCG